MLQHGAVTLRPIEGTDGRDWQAVRERNIEWLRRWEATMPPGSSQRATGYRDVIRHLRKLAREGASLPFAIEVDDQFSGQVTVNNVQRGSAQSASVGYWLDQRVAGRGIMPLAVAMVVDHCLGPVGLHRIEVCVRPENSNSLRVVEKLGLTEVGYAPRFLHIDGDWRDHRIFQVTAEDCPGGLVERVRRH
ncbi:GNAT family N-acetyltransferase [Nocardioides gansuensis]|uniref:GNAT family N-acetyltransferase n=1 Tax=Nocardioides gansuensis TaxID=2138300 RepID=UPI001FEB17E9|nr:GNAT family protein [Nocardioides gansuensis]